MELSDVNKNAKHKFDVLYKTWLGVSPALGTPCLLTSYLLARN